MDLGDAQRRTAAGMDDYLTKPLHVAALAEALERWLPMMTAAASGSGGFATAPPVRGQGIAGGPQVAVPTPTAPLQAAVEPVLMDMERLAQFKEFDDDALTMTREVISLFVADASHRLSAIGEAIRTGDAAALAWAAHALTGATGNVGAVAMQAVCSELEGKAKTGEIPADAPQQFERLQRYWVQTSAILDTWV